MSPVLQPQQTASCCSCPVCECSGSSKPWNLVATTIPLASFEDMSQVRLHLVDSWCRCLKKRIVKCSFSQFKWLKLLNLIAMGLAFGLLWSDSSDFSYFCLRIPNRVMKTNFCKTKDLPPTEELFDFLADAVRISVGEAVTLLGDASDAAIVVFRFRRFSCCFNALTWRIERFGLKLWRYGDARMLSSFWSWKQQKSRCKTCISRK